MPENPLSSGNLVYKLIKWLTISSSLTNIGNFYPNFLLRFHRDYIENIETLPR